MTTTETLKIESFAALLSAYAYLSLFESQGIDQVRIGLCNLLDNSDNTYNLLSEGFKMFDESVTREFPSIDNCYDVLKAHALAIMKKKSDDEEKKCADYYLAHPND